MVKPIYPPRPAGKITPIELPKYERRGNWAVQRKFNGQRNVIHIAADGTVTMFGRHGGPHLNFKPSPELLAEFKALHLEHGKEYWLDSELLDKKTKDPNYKDRIILFDVLQAGRYLFGGPNQAVRLQMLDAICGHPTQREPFHGIALQVTPHIWLAETFADKFVVHFQEILKYDEIEGLVLKRMDSVLDNLGTAEYEIAWQIRCRKPHKNYNF